MGYFLNRLAEPSSHAGIAAAIGAVAAGATGTQSWTIAAPAALFAALSVFMPEKKPDGR